MSEQSSCDFRGQDRPGSDASCAPDLPLVRFNCKWFGRIFCQCHFWRDRIRISVKGGWVGFMSIYVVSSRGKGSAAPTTTTVASSKQEKQEKQPVAAHEDDDLEFDLSQAVDQDNKHGGAGGSSSTDIKTVLSGKTPCRTTDARVSMAAMLAALQAVSGGATSAAASHPRPRSASRAAALPLPLSAAPAVPLESQPRTPEPATPAGDDSEDEVPSDVHPFVRDALDALLQRLEVVEAAMLAANLIAEVPDGKSSRE